MLFLQQRDVGLFGPLELLVAASGVQGPIVIQVGGAVFELDIDWSHLDLPEATRPQRDDCWRLRVDNHFELHGLVA